jgi:hypothetical protein
MRRIRSGCWRARRDRPRRRRAAEKCDELAAPHVLPSIEHCTLPYWGTKYHVVHRGKFRGKCHRWVDGVEKVGDERGVALYLNF